MLHPLLTKDKNNHYKKTDGRQTIQDIEDELTIEQMIGYCLGNIMKYAARTKGSDIEDYQKQIKYGDYLAELMELRSVVGREMKVTQAWHKVKIEWEYNA